jgi:CRISPR-associated Csx11 family protein
MSNLNLQNLNKHKDDILKAEIGALLFNLGKTHIGFWRKKDNNQNNQYFDVDEELVKLKLCYFFTSYKDYHEYKDKNTKEEIHPFEIDLSKFGDLKDFILGQDKKVKFPFEVVIKNEKNKQEANEIIWEEFFKGDNSEVEFIQKVFFRGCENINSGIDKGNPVEQLKPPLWLSNAFGSFKHKIKEEDFDDARIEFFRDLDFFLKENNYYTNPNWQEIREFIFDKVKPWYSKLLSDSRYPVNDVSLWDQAYMTASMFKAVLSNLVLDNSKLQTYQNSPSSIKWRILGIQYDKLGLAEKGFKPAHIDWYRNISKEIDDEIKKLLELKYPIGNEVYRDETGIYFIVGEDLGKDLEDDKVNLAILKDDLKEIKEEILQIFKKKSFKEKSFKEKFLDEFYPAIFLTKASRGLMNLTYLLENARENFLKADWSKKELDTYLKKSESRGARGICQICKQRLVFESDKRDENKNVCEICYKEKTKGRVDKWLNNRTDETIWTAELKDKNDRLALVVMKFELMDWLNGDLLSSEVLNIINWNMLNEELKAFLKDRSYYLEKIKSEILTKLQSLDIGVNKDSSLDEIKLDGKVISEYLKEETKKIIAKSEKIFNNKNYDKYNESLKNLRSNIDNLLKTDLFELKKEIYDKLLNNKLKYNKLKSLIDNEEEIFKGFRENLEYLKGKLIYIKERLSEKAESDNEIEKALKNINVLEQLKIAEKIDNAKILFTEEKVKEIFRKYLPFSLSEEVFNYYRQYNTIYNYYETIFFNSIIGNQWEEFIKQKLGEKIDFGNRKINWEKLDEKDIDFLATLLLQFLLRKNPSPARIRRIWESTQEFFKEIEEKLLCVANIPDDRRSRLYWENVKVKEKEKENYEGEAVYNNLEFWIKDKKCYLITYDPELIEKKLKNENKELTLKLENDETINLKLQDAKIEYYKPYMSIIDPTPISWQFIIPVEYVPNLIKNTQTLYDEYFKYVYGKLPLHIGVIIHDYKQPLYVGISALRKIRRDVKDREKLWEEINITDFKKIFNDKLKKEKIEEYCNNPKEYYSIYFGDLRSGDYKFYISPKDKEYRLKSIYKLQDDEKIEYIPNTFDFEFLDTNTRRNDIYYEESGNCKRKADLKVNRPYNIEKHFNTFEKFKEAFKEGSSTSKLHNIINIFYEKALLEEELDDGTKKFLASVIINTLEPEKSEKVKTFIKSWLGFGDKNITHQEIENSISKEKIKMFIDMFEFWHKALKEV